MPRTITKHVCALLIGLAVSVGGGRPISCADAQPTTASPVLKIASREHGVNRLIEIDCQGAEPGMLLLVGLSAPPSLAGEEEEIDLRSPWSDASLAFVCLVPAEGTSKLVLNDAAMREALGEDVRVIVEVARVASVAVYADRREKGGGSRTVVRIDPATLRPEFQSIHRASDLPAEVGELTLVPEHGYMRVKIDEDDSVVRSVESLPL